LGEGYTGVRDSLFCLLDSKGFYYSFNLPVLFFETSTSVSLVFGEGFLLSGFDTFSRAFVPRLDFIAIIAVLLQKLRILTWLRALRKF
jgi:hypothetical protein